MGTSGYLFAFILLFSCSLKLLNCRPSETSKEIDICQAEELYFEVDLDHFGFARQDTFKIRYFLGDQHFNKNGGPILFYTGNEGNVEMFCKNTGFMWDLAPEFGALVVFAEHRYYGKSLPFGNKTFEDVANLNWLTSEQAMADYAQLIEHLKETIPGSQDSSVITFGGSYGGLLSAFMRISYPHVVTGSLAAAAPIAALSDNSEPYKYFDEVLTGQYDRVSHQCVKNIRQGFDTITAIAKEKGGNEFLASTFNLCSAPKSILDAYTLRGMLVATIIPLELVEYPYPADFMADLPPFPVEVACGFLDVPMEGKELLRGIAKLTNLFYNYTGSLECLDFKSLPGVIETAPWHYQVCAEIMLPMNSQGTGIVFPIPFNPQGFSDRCYQKYKIRPRPKWAPLRWRTRALETTSNIIFSNGVLDPTIAWSLTHNVSSTVVAINIEGGAHHTELRSKNDLDPASVTKAREQIVTIFKEWLHL